MSVSLRQSHCQMTEETRRILQQHDEVDAYEFPRDFDYEALERRALTRLPLLDPENG